MKRILITVAAVIMFAGCADGSNGEASPTSPAASSPAAPESSPADSSAGGEEQAQQVIQQLSDGGIDCKWQPQDGDQIAHTEVCEKHEMVLAASDNPSVINVWVENMQGQDLSGAILHAETYAIISPDAGVINRAWDLLGAEGEVKKL